MGEAAIILGDEAARLRALARQRVLDTGSEEAFDRIARLAARIYDAPIAAVSFVDADRQWFKAIEGLAVCETGRDVSFCAHAIETRAPFAIPDAKADPRFRDNPLVTGPPHIGAYLGAQIVSPDGYALGSLCVIDTRPRPDFTRSGGQTLAELAAVVSREIEMRDFAHTDELTGLASRRFFRATLERERDRAVRFGTPLGAAMLDLDRFKAVNDTHGHGVGDQVLAEAALRFKAEIRGSDLLGRVGGEEFGLVLPGADPEAALRVAERLRDALRAAPIETAAGPIAITASIGIATIAPRQAGLARGGPGEDQAPAVDAEALLDRADANLYAAKNAGRDRIAADPWPLTAASRHRKAAAPVIEIADKRTVA